MNPEDIKVGETYHVLVKVKKNALTENDEFFAVPVDRSGNELNGDGAFFTYSELSAFSPFITSEPPTLVGTNPKNDHCRLYRKGDKVRLIEWNGRKPFDTFHGLNLNPGEVHIVLDDEYARNEVYIGMSAADEEQSVVHACNLELITPVEEMGPFSVRHNAVHAAWSIYGPFDLSAVNYFYGERYPYTKETAKAAAEAECARLNEDYKKKAEMKDQRYKVVQLNQANGKSVYLVADTKKMFDTPEAAAYERDRLNDENRKELQ